jgi:hypothetical protein
VITIYQLINGLFMGSVLIALGLYPRLLQTLAEAIIAFSNQLPNGLPIVSVSITLFRRRRRFAAIGAALIVFSFAAYLIHA